MTDELVSRLRDRREFINRGNGDVQDIPDVECQQAADELEARARRIAELERLVRKCAETSCEGYCGPDLGMVTGVDCWGCEIIATLTAHKGNDNA